jgi:hypothetical protein
VYLHKEAANNARVAVCNSVDRLGFALVVLYAGKNDCPPFTPSANVLAVMFPPPSPRVNTNIMSACAKLNPLKAGKIYRIPTPNLTGTSHA